MSTTPSPSSTALELPPSLESMLAEDVKDWCKSNWTKIEDKNITTANIKTLIGHLRGGKKSFKNKEEGVAMLLGLIHEKVPEEGEKLEEKEEERLIARTKGQKRQAVHEEEEEEEEEVGMKGKECEDAHPVKKVHKSKRPPIALPEATLSVVEKASYFLDLTYGKLGMFLLYS